MHGVTAGLDQAEDALQTSLIFRHTERCAGNEAKRCQADDVSQIELFKLLIVRNVEKTGVRFNAWLWHCYAISVLK